ncbi:hypothetical protein CSA17_01660 [bacterium DOLJORAL78_65_58]|nr:MAG: hypothetical protein CSA17_01660 [bacterium DOLJORAL78_65_58]
MQPHRPHAALHPGRSGGGHRAGGHRLWPFVATENFARPYVELKTATSLDGRFAPPEEQRRPREPFFLTGRAARRDVHRRRRWVDLVLVGEGTVRADRPRLDGRLAAGDDDLPQTEPLAGYVDTDLSWQGGCQRDSYLVFAGESARGSAGVAAVKQDGGRIIYCPEKEGRVDPAALLTQAQDLGLRAIMLEGGPRLAGAFLRAGLVDRWARYLAPVVLGGGVGWSEISGFQPDRGFSLTGSKTLQEDLLIIHDRRHFARVLEQVSR